MGVEVQLLSFLTSALVEGEWSGSLPGSFKVKAKSRQNPLSVRFDGLESQSGRFGEKIGLLLLPGSERQPLQLVTLTTMSWLPF